MRNETREKWDQYIARQAELNSISPDAVTKNFNVAPSVAQTLEDKVQQSSDFLQKINVVSVPEQEGEKIGLGINGPLASTSDSTTDRRNPRSVHTLEDNGYRCEKTNTDTFISYAQLDMWGKFKDFQTRITNQIIRRRGLDRITVGFNGTLRAAKSDLAANPLLQDINIGWLEKYRQHAPQRVMKNVTITSRDDENKIIAKGDYGNLDSLAFDATSNLLDEWNKGSLDLVVICGRNIVTSKDFAIINAISASNPNSEALAGKLLVASKTIGNMPSYIAPFFPDGAMLITPFKNLSIYWQEAKHRRMIKEEPELNRIATYESSNDAYVVEDYGFGCLIEGIAFAKAPGATE
ncbi:phage major capsid protein, P2 family [Photorhabdus laumondii subsp. laumondii]|uniref:Phage major capsid protein, P2 family n=1 Tax=Photorhabdus laumondii subsp. laumondii TaxID=141679 RepID=A0A6L9JNQ5_PHOLM|nr:MULTISPECIES: phage major capsid protein, P2 family [Photorhabdus]AXG42663.1 phage major capsid protein, P2 family [Photorhabdus laumondii subsp. laumondii]MCC8384745.1 phage major capsid protein, P2 family [Photorhabdus laumondii]MCC8413482.1 phage major capsid protein, P2 family [Photorhabdus laumondii]NDK96472.1 phage major capsid protein, P2 family [Photorhabdus laumondii subsp. laumondii]NDL17955.1 phage major capsid protein, P2 family [Photorhabdus laumondii subsp. laumondii]